MRFLVGLSILCFSLLSPPAYPAWGGLKSLWTSGASADNKETLRAAFEGLLGDRWNACEREPLLGFTEREIAKLSSAHKTELLARVSQAYLDPQNSNFLGAVVPERDLPRLHLRDSILAHPFSNHVIVHELSHLSRLPRYGRISPLEDEELAFADQYDYVRAAYRIEQVEEWRVRASVPLELDDIVKLNRLGYLTREGKFAPLDSGQRSRLVSDPELQRIYYKLLNLDYDKKLAADLGYVFSMTRAQYVQFRLTSVTAYDHLRKPSKLSCTQDLSHK